MFQFVPWGDSHPDGEVDVEKTIDWLFWLYFWMMSTLHCKCDFTSINSEHKKTTTTFAWWEHLSFRCAWNFNAVYRPIAMCCPASLDNIVRYPTTCGMLWLFRKQPKQWPVPSRTNDTPYWQNFKRQTSHTVTKTYCMLLTWKYVWVGSAKGFKIKY